MLTDTLYLGTITLSTIISLPVDFIKTQLQLTGSIRNQPWRHQFIGADTVLLKSLIFLSLKKKLLKSTYESDKLFLISRFSVLAYVLSPFDHILVKLQTRHMRENAKVSNTWNTFLDIYSKEGLRGLYKGGPANFFKFFSYMVAGEMSNLALVEYYVVFWKYFLAMVALIPATIASHPFDVIKAHQQYYSSENKTAFQTCLNIYSQRGLSGFYLGMGQAYARSCFITVCTIFGLEITS